MPKASRRRRNKHRRNERKKAEKTLVPINYTVETKLVYEGTEFEFGTVDK